MTDSRKDPFPLRSGRLAGRRTGPLSALPAGGPRVRIFGPEAETAAPTPAESRLQQIHARAALAADPDLVTCASCREDLGAPELNYRLVLRCSSPDRYR